MANDSVNASTSSVNASASSVNASASSSSSSSTPSETYASALNYTINDLSEKTQKGAAYFKNLLTKINNSIYMYPTISIVFLTMTNLFILFSKSIHIIIKIISVIILLLYIGFTIYWFKK